MHYVELDAGNLAKWLAGTIPGSGHNSYDPLTAPNDYSVYFSDRRGNWVNGATLPALAASFLLSERNRRVRLLRLHQPFGHQYRLPQTGLLNPAEDLDQVGILFTYGQDPGHEVARR